MLIYYHVVRLNLWNTDSITYNQGECSALAKQQVANRLRIS